MAYIYYKVSMQIKVIVFSQTQFPQDKVSRVLSKEPAANMTPASLTLEENDELTLSKMKR